MTFRAVVGGCALGFAAGWGVTNASLVVSGLATAGLTAALPTARELAVR